MPREWLQRATRRPESLSGPGSGVAGVIVIVNEILSEHQAAGAFSPHVQSHDILQSKYVGSRYVQPRYFGPKHVEFEYARR